MLRVWYPFLCPPAFRACAIGAAPIGDGCARAPARLLPPPPAFLPCSSLCVLLVVWSLRRRLGTTRRSLETFFRPLGLRRSRRGHCDPLAQAGFSPFDKAQKWREESPPLGVSGLTIASTTCESVKEIIRSRRGAAVASPRAPSGPVPPRPGVAGAARRSKRRRRSAGDRPKRGPSAFPGHLQPSLERQQQRTPRLGDVPAAGALSRTSSRCCPRRRREGGRRVSPLLSPWRTGCEAGAGRGVSPR